MFRVNPEAPFTGPHQNGSRISTGPNPDEAEAAAILIHGRGSSARQILTLAEEINEPTVHFIAPEAKRFTWYPHSFLVPEEQNQPHLNSALQVIHDQIQELISSGLEQERIVLAGFSQGACLASEFAARHPGMYGGVAVLSGGLIGETLNEEEYNGSMGGTPVFLGCSDVDPHIPVERVHQTEKIYEKLGANITKKIYKGMAHTVNSDELGYVKRMFLSIRATH